MEIFVYFCFVVAIALLWLRVKDIERVRDDDCRYFDWYIRSLEARKQDTDEAIAEREDF